MSTYNFGVAIHGGAGTILKSKMTAEKEVAYTNALTEARDAAYQVLLEGGSSILAVEAAVVSLEDCPLFNAGRGSVFNSIGEHEMDASIMEGKNLEAGAVAAVSGYKNPIKLANMVLQHSDHVMMMGEGVAQFVDAYHPEKMPHEYFHDEYRFNQWQKVKGTEKIQLDHSDDKPYLGTVGAVALDKFGNLTAGTSTGGMTNKKYGRVGDSPIIGAGNYANNKTCAISCTGSGEYFMRALTAFDVSARMEYKKLSLAEAAKEAIMDRLTEINGDGGLIGIDQKGNITMPFNSEGMYRASRNQEHEMVAIYK